MIAASQPIFLTPVEIYEDIRATVVAEVHNDVKRIMSYNNDVIWVKIATYCKKWQINYKTFKAASRQALLKKNKAICGVGKATRVNVFFNVLTGKWQD